MPDQLANPVVVDFPLRGSGWMAVTTPAARVPSHGVDILGQRYAYDFVRVDDRPGVHVHPTSTFLASTIGGRTSECYAWGATVHAPFDAEVVGAVDGVAEREWVNPFREAGRMIWNGLTFRPEKIPSILGNHVILRAGDVYAGFAHLVTGSVEVANGQRVVAGDILGRVGHTGNSTSPHLHFQLMDSADLMAAQGIACAFSAYEVWRDGSWHRVERGIPGPRERIRWVDAG
ncbi:M23 family metallopeptidase [Microbacterium sp. CFBP9034]|uniref:M23 family metallopeptidase n=1 Tax=Microbacterium sp. CFBP9034 TaxID=3096540 RepID=UPI002A6AF421|nr:M23 family metallopeptidase [Microbacterium sp. CFBP9034]MDY0908669.1 M23 family metallopeptidase [Microbacterium sp. CFBP9034]